MDKKNLQERATYVQLRNEKSKMKQSVRQGGVLSPILFSFYMSSMPLPSVKNIKVVTTYTDDIYITISSPKTTEIELEI